MLKCPQPEVKHVTKQEAIDHFGGVTGLAAALNIKPQAVSQWKVIPAGRQYELEVKTGGVLKADSKAA